MLACRFIGYCRVRPRLLYIKEVRSPDRTLRIETIQSFILHPLSFILHPLSFILHPSSYSNDRYGAIFSITESGRVGIVLSSPILSSVKRLRRSV